uniref:DUF7342 family protein n=1 Tax=Halomarina oriensis TaxID=671145 RepID=UPI001E4D2017|nr:hypothetical protein [Halomarina oriensis]
MTDEYSIGSLEEFRETLDDDDLSAGEIRSRQNVINTWEAVNTEIRLHMQALRLYEGITPLSAELTHQ